MTATTSAPASVTELAELVRSHAAERTPLRIAGRDTWRGDDSPAARMDAALPTLSLARYAGIDAYVPADLTITVRAGTTLAELDAATARHNQWCPLLPWGGDDGTIGATFASATVGPCAAALGRPRDLALGIEFVDGSGTPARGGGRVVKNVAGFDLTRLMVGAFGTLGVITEVTVRLRARPPADVTLQVTPRDGASPAGDATLAAALRAAGIQPMACVAVTGSAAASLGVADGVVLARYGGNRALVDAGRAAAAALGAVDEVGADVWTRLRTANPFPRNWNTPPQAPSVAERLRARFDPSGILNAGLLARTA